MRLRVPSFALSIFEDLEGPQCVIAKGGTYLDRPLEPFTLLRCLSQNHLDNPHDLFGFSWIKRIGMGRGKLT